jgi:2-polyprenyl-6-methoxyphenol hydroxylase-like FAD-dependent oxidoreductase
MDRSASSDCSFLKKRRVERNPVRGDTFLDDVVRIFEIDPTSDSSPWGVTNFCVAAKGIAEFRAAIVELAPFLQDRVGELRDWNDLKLLTVRVDRLRQWHRPGLVCVGDAAHAMSPVGGVGINLAIQDAVAAANILAGPLGEGAVSAEDLAKIQRRRSFPTRLTQSVQALIQKRIAGRGLGSQKPTRLPWIVRLMERTTLPVRLRNRVIPVGIRPEHVKTPDVLKAA